MPYLLPQILVEKVAEYLTNSDGQLAVPITVCPVVEKVAEYLTNSDRHLLIG